MLLLDSSTRWVITAAGSTPGATTHSSSSSSGSRGRSCRLPGYSSAAATSAIAEFATTATLVLRLECFANCFAESAGRGGQVLQAFALAVQDLLNAHRIR